ncbi:MAG: hypothetical protein JXR83_06890 [Deltaproteobacteria bacterium]|nr:hypothetical protein [Deltaproteobacteria bacterium]
MAGNEHSADDRPLLTGDVLAFPNTAAIERAVMAIEDLNGLSAGAADDPPPSGARQIQLALGDQVRPERHLVRVTPLGKESVALAFNNPASAIQALREITAPVDAAAIGLELQPVDAASIGLELVEVPPEAAAPAGTAPAASPAANAPPDALDLVAEQAAAKALAALEAFDATATDETAVPPPAADEMQFDDSAVQTAASAPPESAEFSTDTGIAEEAATPDVLASAAAALDVAALESELPDAVADKALVATPLEDVESLDDFEDAPTTEAALAIEAAGMDEGEESGGENEVEPPGGDDEEIVVELVGGGEEIAIEPPGDSEEIVVELVGGGEETAVEPSGEGSEAVAETASEPELPSAVVLLIEETLTFDSAGAVAGFINELQEDGGVVVESLGAQVPESGQIELGLSLAGQPSAARHHAVAMQEDDDRVALVFRDPDAVIADLRQLESGTPAAPSAAPRPKAGPRIGGPSIELGLDDDLAAAMAEAEAKVGGPKAAVKKTAGGKTGPAVELEADDAIAAALAEIEGGGSSRQVRADDGDSDGASSAAPKGPPKVAASKLPPPLPEEEKALAAGALVNPVAPKDLLTLRLAKQVDPRGRPQQSLFDLLGGLAMIRATGELHMACGDLRLMLPFLDGPFFARDDELDALERAMRHPTGRFALLDLPVKSTERSRVSRPPRVMVIELLRRILLGHDPDELQAGLSAIRYKYALTVPNISYVALGFRMTPKENVFLSSVTDGSRAVSELAGASTTMTFGEAAAFVYLCIVFDLIKLLDEPRAAKKGPPGLIIKK